MNKKGSILIISLWVLFLLSAFAVMLGVQVRQKLILVKRIEARNKLLAVAEAGVAGARMFVLQQPEDKTYHCLKDDWSSNVYAFQRKPFGDGFYTIYVDIPAEGVPPASIGIPPPGRASAQFPVVRRYGMADEESKVNLNKATQDTVEVLRRLFQSVLGADETQAQSLAASVIDWKDEDSDLSMPTGSAEDSYYHSLPAAYDAKDKKFECLEELLLVKGFDQASLDALRPYITIYGSGRINVNTASQPVLLACGLPEAVVAAIIEYRLGKDSVAGTADDGFFENVSEITTKVPVLQSLSPQLLTQVNDSLSAYCGVRSSAFSIRSKGEFEKGTEYSEIECVVDNKGVIVYYHQR